jgi:hypothetical protein
VLPLDAGEVDFLSYKRHDTATTRVIVYEPGVDGRSAYEGVSTVVGIREAAFFIGRSADNQRPIVDFLVTYCMRVDDFDALTVRRAAEGPGVVLKGTTEVPVEPTTICIVPSPALAVFLDK